MKPLFELNKNLNFKFELTFLIFLMSLTVFVISGCDNSSETVKANKKGKIESRNKEVRPIDKIVVYDDCTDYVTGTSTSSCTEPHCNCPGGYSRHALDPCDYSTMGDYMAAVVCELNRISTNCSVPGLPYGCTEIEKCIKGLDVPAAFLHNHPYSNPWIYCASATDCADWTCPTAVHDLYVHIYLSTDDQDILVNYAWDLATNNAPTCPSTGFPAIPYAVYFKYCYQGNYPFNCYDDNVLCTNMDIRLHVLYKCCN